MLSVQRVFIAIWAYTPAAEQGAKGGSYYCYYLFTASVAQLFTLRREGGGGCTFARRRRARLFHSGANSVALT